MFGYGEKIQKYIYKNLFYFYYVLILNLYIQNNN